MAFLRGRRKLRIGFYEEDGIVRPTPGCKRAVREAARMMEAAGHEVTRLPHNIESCFSQTKMRN